MAGKPVAASWRCGCWLLWGCVCRWAAARPRDRHTRAFGSESSISKPGQALPPPTGTSARLRGPRGSLNKGRCLVCWWVIGVVLKPGQALRYPPHRWGFSLLCTSHPGPAAHRHRGQAPRASRCPQQRAVPGVLVGDRRRFEARPGPAPAHRHRSWAPAGGCMPCVGFQSGPLGGAALGAGWRRVAGVSRL